MWWIRKISLIVHLLSASVIIGGVFASAIILVKNKIPAALLPYLKTLWTAMTIAVGTAAISGIFLAAREWNELGFSPLFWTKMVLLGIDGLIGGRVLGIAIKNYSSRGKFLRIPGQKRVWLALIIFVTIATLGVFL